MTNWLVPDPDQRAREAAERARHGRRSAEARAVVRLLFEEAGGFGPGLDPYFIADLKGTSHEPARLCDFTQHELEDATERLADTGYFGAGDDS